MQANELVAGNAATGRNDVPVELVQKLGIKPGQRICLLEATPAMAALLRATCADVEFEEAITRGHYDLVFFWPRTLDGFAARLMGLQRAIAPDGAIWVVIPKQAIARKRGFDFTWEQMQAAALTTNLVDDKAAALTTNLVDDKAAALSDEEYATRFVIRKGRRGDHQPVAPGHR